MTVDQILIVVFGTPTIGLLTSIFFKMGKLEQATESQKASIKALWDEVNRVKERVNVTLHRPA